MYVLREISFEYVLIPQAFQEMMCRSSLPLREREAVGDDAVCCGAGRHGRSLGNRLPNISKLAAMLSSLSEKVVTVSTRVRWNSTSGSSVVVPRRAVTCGDSVEAVAEGSEAAPNRERGGGGGGA